MATLLRFLFWRRSRRRYGVVLVGHAVKILGHVMFPRVYYRWLRGLEATYTEPRFSGFSYGLAVAICGIRSFPVR
ncbi:hypothetical protein ACOSOMT5_P3055 [Acidiphilium sp. MT5]